MADVNDCGGVCRSISLLWQRAIDGADDNARALSRLEGEPRQLRNDQADNDLAIEVFSSVSCLGVICDAHEASLVS